jgi:hypothetical protein
MERKRLSTKKKKILPAVEKKFFRTAAYTLFDQKRNGEIMEELKVEPVDESLRRYKTNWLQGHVTRMKNRMPKIMLNIKPNRGRQFGKILKRLFDEADTDPSKPKS